MKKREYTEVGELRVEPIPYIEISNIDIIAEKNSHTFVYAEGKIHSEDRRALDCLRQFGTEIIIRKGKDTVLFRGLITELSVEECAEAVTVIVRGATHTILLDRKKKTKPFHDINETIKGIIQSVAKGTKGAQTIIESRCEEQIGQFIMQYEETDWEFIKRMASHCGQSVFPDSVCDRPAFYIGKPTLLSEIEITDEIPYTLSWHAQTQEPLISNTSGMTYLVRLNDKCLKLGECIKFKGSTLYVKALHMHMEQAVLNNDYELCTREGLDTSRSMNTKLVGREVTGIVEEVKRDNVKVHIIAEDGCGNGEACWFPYSTVYASSDDSGWYCMPEPEDKVRLRFPGGDEKNAYAVSAVSEYVPENEKSDRMRDYSVRYIRNRQGMEIMWSPNRVSISANGANLIDINQNGTLFLSSNSKITIHAEKDVAVEAGNQIHFNAGGNIRISCGAKAEIHLNESGVIELKGNEVHTN